MMSKVGCPSRFQNSNQNIIFRNLIEYWQLICCDLELVGTILDNFLAMLSTSCLYEPDEAKDDTQRIATVQPFAIFCALKEIFACREVQTVSNAFPRN